MRRGISNFQIENAIKNIGNEDLDDNFVGVFHQILWINLLTISEKKNVNIASLLTTLTVVKKEVHTGGAIGYKYL